MEYYCRLEFFSQSVKWRYRVRFDGLLYIILFLFFFCFIINKTFEFRWFITFFFFLFRNLDAEWFFIPRKKRKKKNPKTKTKTIDSNEWKFHSTIEHQKYFESHTKLIVILSWEFSRHSSITPLIDMKFIFCFVFLLFCSFFFILVNWIVEQFFRCCWIKCALFTDLLDSINKYVYFV